MLLKTISISIICSILFTYLVKPLLDSRKFTLDIRVIRKLKSDKIYKTIALGFHEYSNLLCLAIIIGIIIGIVLSIILLYLLEGFNLNFTTTVNNNLNIKIGLFILGFFIFTISYLLSELRVIIYINLSIAYFNQLLKIASPYINNNDINMYESKFAKIKCKDDYIKCIEELKSVCTSLKIQTHKYKFKY